MKKSSWMLVLLIWILVWAVPGMAEDRKTSTGDKKEPASVGESIGSTARQVVDDSKETYQETKDVVVKTYREVVEDIKKSVKEAKEDGAKTVEDIKKGYQKKEPPEETRAAEKAVPRKDSSAKDD